MIEDNRAAAGFVVVPATAPVVELLGLVPADLPAAALL